MKFSYYAAVFAAWLCSVMALNATIKDDKTGLYCIVLEGNFTGTISYENSGNGTSTYDFSADENTLNISGDCHAVLPTNATAQTLTISFLPANVTEAPVQWDAVVTFEHDEESTFKVSGIEFTVAFWPELHAKSKLPIKYQLNGGDDNWAVTENHGYQCSSTALKDGNGTSLVFHNLRALAFAQAKEPTFPKGQIFELCTLDTQTSELVPIIVGACLAGLVIVVLIAYLIGRARAKRQGYASV